MSRFFLLAMLAATVLAMGMGAASAQEDATANESEREWPTDVENVTVGDVRDALEESADELPRESVEAIVEWATSRDNLEELGKSERDQLYDWLLEATVSFESIERPDLPNVPELFGDDRADQDDAANVTDDELAALLEDGESPDEYDEIVDDQIRVVDWTYSDGMFRIRFENIGQRPRTVTVSEATQPDEGSSTFSIRQERLLAGQTTVTLPATSFNGAAAVSITTADSIKEGRGVRLSTGRAESNPFDYFGGTSGLFAGVLLSVTMAAGGAGFVLWREDDDVVVA